MGKESPCLCLWSAVLDEINDNLTDYPLLEHITDTAGYSDLIFTLFDLLGKVYAPRLWDIEDQRLCKIKLKEWAFTQLKFTATVNIEYIRKHWDDLLSLAASIKTGTVSASLFTSKLQAYPRQSNLIYVLQAYSLLIKTIFICRYLLELPLRRKINTQLIKGGQLHNLRLYL